MILHRNYRINEKFANIFYVLIVSRKNLLPREVHNLPFGEIKYGLRPCLIVL